MTATSKKGRPIKDVQGMTAQRDDIVFAQLLQSPAYVNRRQAQGITDVFLGNGRR